MLVNFIVMYLFFIIVIFLGFSGRLRVVLELMVYSLLGILGI